MKSSDVISALEKYYSIGSDAGEWGMVTELEVGYSRVDAYLIRAWSGKPKGHERVLIEIKVSRSDFLREQKKPWKMRNAARTAHRAYYATPEGIIKDSDDLGDVGHLIVHEDGTITTRKRARRNNNPEPLSESVQAAIFRRLSRSEWREEFSKSSHGQETILAMQRQNNNLFRKNETLAREVALMQRRSVEEINRFMQVFHGMRCLCNDYHIMVHGDFNREGHVVARFFHRENYDVCEQLQALNDAIEENPRNLPATFQRFIRSAQ